MKTLSVMGRLGRNPELRKLPSGDSVLTLPVAVNEPIRQQDGSWQDETTWIDVSCFGKLAESLARRLEKGDPVAASGELHVRTYTGRDGTAKTRIEVRASRCAPCVVKKRREEGASAPQRAPESTYDSFGVGDDDIPF